jgi:RNA polymerase sigma-70 factor (ECF subfamily)
MPDESSLKLDEDTRLMVKARDGDHSAYETLYRRHFRTVVSYLANRTSRGQACEDLAQEVFARIWRQRSRYQPLAPLRSYLLGVAANVLREDRAKSREPIPLDTHALEALPDTSRPAPPSQAQSAEQLQAVRTLMASLPPRQRQAVELMYLAGLSPEDAARRLDCSIKTLYAHLYEARKRLRRLVHGSQ